MQIQFNLNEHLDKECAFFALYAGLRMYKEKRRRRVKDKEKFSVAALEAGLMLSILKDDHPKQYKQAEQEFEWVYGVAANN